MLDGLRHAKTRLCACETAKAHISLRIHVESLGTVDCLC